MWIRSQNKRILVDSTSLCINNNGCIYDNYDNNLGNYKTDERCIKVLDMIQHNVTHQLRAIFEMPQE